MDPLPRLRSALADRYAIEREIGRGGMAIVFLARDLRHNRNVAIKVLRPEFALQVSAERFLQEIRFEALLKHPYIMPLFDSGDADGLPYFVMPHVEGPSLRARLNRDMQLPLEEAVRITSEVAEALAYAHGRGIVHRDVKPGNILLEGGHALLADFGIARALTAVAGNSLTDTGLVVGTPEYMSPEQASEHGKVDGRTDIYALGCVLYEMLSGEPPFSGPTPQAIIARHMHEPPRSLRIVRATIPEHVERAIHTALAKTPSDRFATAGEFITALGPEGQAAAITRTLGASRRRQVRRTAGVLGGVAVVASLAVWRHARSSAPPLDPNKVVLFPLTERGLVEAASGSGYDVAVMLSAALEHAQPLKWIDGAQRLEQPGIANMAVVSARELRNVARSARAGFYLDGAVVRGGHDSTTVVLRLHDTAGDSVVAQESASAPGGGASAVQLGLRAVTRLLPALLDPGRAIDLSALSARKASATALWIQGEREYRGSRFRNAYDFYRRAVGEDSAMAFAALKGAQAAGWEELEDEARDLMVVALRGRSSLPSKHQALARGWSAFLSGDADTAVAWLSRALAEDPEWAEAHMALGEVYYHLLPGVPLPLDSLAESEFAAAARYDHGFAPPLYHLAEAAVRRDDLAKASALIARFLRFDPDSSRGRQLSIIYDCAKGGPAAVKWKDEESNHPLDLLQAARTLSVGGAHNGCAERGFRALLADSGADSLHWGALLGLNGVLMSQGRHRELVASIDSAASGDLVAAPGLYFIDALAGGPVEAEAEATDSRWRRLYGEHYEGVSPPTRLLLAEWYAHRRDTVRVKSLRAGLLADPSVRSSPLRATLDGHLALSRGDTAGAVASFRTLQVNAPAEALEWGRVEPLAVERLVMARYALARGDFAEALRVAGGFDHPAPVAFLPFVPAALEIRLRAAQGMGRPDLVTRFQSRIRRLQVPVAVAAGF